MEIPWSVPRLQKAISGVREPAQRGGLGEDGSTAELGEHARGGRADGDCRCGREELLEMLATQRALELDDRGGARESHRADLVALDPRAAVVHVERRGGIGAIRLDLSDVDTELRE